MLSLVAACSDKRLLGATLDLYPRQLELLKRLDDRRIITHVWAVGRQAGKSTLAAMAAVHNAALKPDLDKVLPRGRVRYILVAAPGLAQAQEFIRLCSALVDASPSLARMASVKGDRIDFALPGGARSCIRALPADSRSIRGMSVSMVIIDEMAHMDDTAGPGSDERMFAALEPSTRVFGDRAQVLLISTPFGEVGKFYELYQAAETGVLPASRAVHAPVWEIDTSLTEAWRERKRVEVGEDTFHRKRARARRVRAEARRRGS